VARRGSAGSGASRQEPLRIGVIGTGLAVERLHWPALVQMQERFRVVAFANDTREPAERFARLAELSAVRARLR
jgi:predicted dehydrogenase